MKLISCNSCRFSGATFINTVPFLIPILIMSRQTRGIHYDWHWCNLNKATMCPTVLFCNEKKTSMLMYRYEYWQKQDCCYLQLDRQQVCRTRVVQFLRSSIWYWFVARRQVFRRRGWFYRCFHWQYSSAISQPLIRSCYVNALARVART